MLMTCAAPANLCLFSWKDEISNKPLGCGGGTGRVREWRGTLGHQLSLGGVKVEDNFPGLWVNYWADNKLHLDAD